MWRCTCSGPSAPCASFSTYEHRYGWPDTYDAEYVALTQLHADALITLDRQLADAVKDLATVAPIEALY